MSSAKRFVVVVNPRGGTRRGVEVLESVKPVFVAAGAELDVHVTTHAGHAKEIARTVNLGAYDGFCVVGGDGRAATSTRHFTLHRGRVVTRPARQATSRETCA